MAERLYINVINMFSSIQFSSPGLTWCSGAEC